MAFGFGFNFGFSRRDDEQAFLDLFSATAAYSLDTLSPYATSTVRARNNFGTEVNLQRSNYWPNKVPTSLISADIQAQYNTIMNFDGSDDDIGIATSLLPASADFDLEIDFFVRAAPTTSIGLYGSLNAGAAGRHVLQITTAAQAFFFGNGPGALTTANTLNFNAINTYRLRRVSNTFFLSLNGGAEVSATGAITLDISGANIGDPYSGDNFNGGITAIRLDGTEIWDGTAADATANGWTLNGTPATFTGQGFNATVSRWFDQSVPTGKSDISMGNSATSYIDAGVALGAFSTFKQTVLFRTNNNGAIQTMADSRDGAGDGVNMGIDSRASSGADQGKVFFNCNSVTIYSANVYHDDNIYTAVGEYDGTTMYLTIYDENGVQLEQQSSATSETFNVSSNTIIGSRAFSSKSNPWSKYFGMIKVETDGNTVFEYNFDNIDGVTIPDISGNNNDGTIVGTDVKRADMKNNIIANDAIQTTVASQPLLVQNGQLVTSGGIPALQGFSTSFLSIDTSSYSIGNLSQFIVTNLDSAVSTALASNISRFDSSRRWYMPYVASGKYYFSYGGSITAIELGGQDTNRHVFSAIAGASTTSAYEDGVVGSPASVASTTGITAIDTGIFGLGIGSSWIGKIQEMILFNSDQTSNRIDIEQNINSRWEVY